MSCTPERKTEKVRRLVAAGAYKEALNIAKDFRLGIADEDRDDMRRGYECIVHPRFYQSLGMNTRQIAEKGVETVKRLYGTQQPT